MPWIVILLGYFLGAIPTAYIAGRLQGKNILQLGDRNMGAANAFRHLGAKSRFFGDFDGFSPPFNEIAKLIESCGSEQLHAPVPASEDLTGGVRVRSICHWEPHEFSKQ